MEFLADVLLVGGALGRAYIATFWRAVWLGLMTWRKASGAQWPCCLRRWMT